MAITRSTASRVRSGRVGDTTYYTSQGREISRAALNSSNYGASASRTNAQQTRRVKWANLVNFYKVSKGWMSKAFENKKSGVSDYNMLMKINVNGSSIALTKEQAASGACVAEPYQVTQGGLMPIECVKDGDVWKTNIAVGMLNITANTTIKEFTAAVLGANSWLANNMQISFISYQQTRDTNNVPRIICTAYELTLSLTSQELMRDYLPDFCSSVKDGYLATNNNISIGAFTYVLSNSDGGKTYVSTQVLVNNNEAMIKEFSSAEQLEKAIKSYGQDGNVFLDSGSGQTNATDQPFAILSVVDGDGKSLLTNEWTLNMDEESAIDIYVTASQKITSATVTSITCGEDKDKLKTYTDLGSLNTIITNNMVNLNYTTRNFGTEDDYVSEIKIVVNGVEHTIGGGYVPGFGE